MTHSLFGSNLDLHSGGVDLKFPHHTNEIAQCEAYGCGGVLAEGAGVAGVAEAGPGGAGAGGGARVGARKPWVRHWVHTGHLNIEGLKMSKSLKNFVTVREFLEGHRDGREAAAEDFRMFCLMHKYSSRCVRDDEGSSCRGVLVLILFWRSAVCRACVRAFSSPHRLSCAVAAACDSLTDLSTTRCYRKGVWQGGCRLGLSPPPPEADRCL